LHRLAAIVFARDWMDLELRLGHIDDSQPIVATATIKKEAELNDAISTFDFCTHYFQHTGYYSARFPLAFISDLVSLVRNK